MWLKNKQKSRYLVFITRIMFQYYKSYIGDIYKLYIMNR